MVGLLWSLTGFGVIAKAFGDEISNRYSPIPTFRDDRYVGALNQNFQRLTYRSVTDGGFNVLNRSTSLVIVLNLAQTDTNYGIWIQTSWVSTMTTVMDKTLNAFKVQFSSPGSASGGTFDWTLVR